MSKYRRGLPPLSTLIAFEAVCRRGSFSQAANEVSRSQASVSRQMKQLEQSLETRLFERLRYSVEPTANGRMLYSSIKPLLDEVLKTTEKIRLETRGQNNVTIFSDISIASALISPVLGEFQRRYPQTQVKLLSSYESLEQTTEVFDLGLQVGKMASQLFDIHAIADDAIFPVCAPAFAQRHKCIDSIDQLCELPLLHLDDMGRGWPDWHEFLEHYDKPGYRSESELIFTTYNVCLEVAMKGEGVALGWARSVKNLIDENKLVRLTDFVIHMEDCIYIYLPKAVEPRPKVAELIEIIQEHIPQLSY